MSNFKINECGQNSNESIMESLSFRDEVIDYLKNFDGFRKSLLRDQFLEAYMRNLSKYILSVLVTLKPEKLADLKKKFGVWPVLGQWLLEFSTFLTRELGLPHVPDYWDFLNGCDTINNIDVKKLPITQILNYFPLIYSNETYYFRDASGQVMFPVAVFYIHFKRAMLPVIYCKLPNDTDPWPMHILPQGPQPLLNMDIVKAARTKMVIISKSIYMAGNNQSMLSPFSDLCWIGWYGGIETVPSLDLSPLKGKQVCIMVDDYFDELEHLQTLELADHIANKLRGCGVKDYCFIENSFGTGDSGFVNLFEHNQMAARKAQAYAYCQKQFGYSA